MLLPRRWVRTLVMLALVAAVTLGGPAHAARETGTGPAIGCSSSAFDTSTDIAGVNLDPQVLVSALTATLGHVCRGPVYARGAVLVALAPTGGQAAVAVATVRATCAGGGCDLTGTPLDPAPASVAEVLRVAGQPVTIVTMPVIAVFPDLPPGRYTVEVTVLGLNATLASGQVHVFGHGAAGGGRGARP